MSSAKAAQCGACCFAGSWLYGIVSHVAASLGVAICGTCGYSHDSVDSGQLLEDGDQDRHAQLRPVAALHDGAVGVPHLLADLHRFTDILVLKQTNEQKQQRKSSSKKLVHDR